MNSVYEMFYRLYQVSVVNMWIFFVSFRVEVTGDRRLWELLSGGFVQELGRGYLVDSIHF
jgi:hypothetical protein